MRCVLNSFVFSDNTKWRLMALMARAARRRLPQKYFAQEEWVQATLPASILLVVTTTCVCGNGASPHFSDLERLRRPARGVAIAVLVREAIGRMRQEQEASWEAVPSETSGLRQGEDGLTHQERLRGEWK